MATHKDSISMLWSQGIYRLAHHIIVRIECSNGYQRFSPMYEGIESDVLLSVEEGLEEDFEG